MVSSEQHLIVNSVRLTSFALLTSSWWKTKSEERCTAAAYPSQLKEAHHCCYINTGTISPVVSNTRQGFVTSPISLRGRGSLEAAPCLEKGGSIYAPLERETWVPLYPHSKWPLCRDRAIGLKLFCGIPRPQIALSWPWMQRQPQSLKPAQYISQWKNTNQPANWFIKWEFFKNISGFSDFSIGVYK